MILDERKKYMKPKLSAIEKFFSATAYAVIGASEDRKKFGNIVFRSMKERGMVVYPVNPYRESVEGCRCYASIRDLPDGVSSVVTLTHPAATESIIHDIAKKKIDSLWMQPGSDSKIARDEAEANGITVLCGQCILMFLEPVASVHSVHRFINKMVGAYPR